MAKGDTADTSTTTPAPPASDEIIEKWFNETFYNRALDTDFFNYIMTAKEELKERFKGGA